MLSDPFSDTQHFSIKTVNQSIKQSTKQSNKQSFNKNINQAIIGSINETIIQEKLH